MKRKQVEAGKREQVTGMRGREEERQKIDRKAGEEECKTVRVGEKREKDG